MMSAPPDMAQHFVRRAGAQLTLDGKPWYFAGANNDMGHFDSRSVDDAFTRLAGMNLRVVRVWAYRDRGALDGSMPVTLCNLDLLSQDYRQYWDKSANAVAYNDGANGLQNLDYVIARAAAHDMRVIVTMTNNWADYGGADQYNVWFNLPYHDSFFTDAQARTTYRNWVAHVIQHRNALTGLALRDDPTILSWELMNEPFCFTDGTNTQRMTSIGSSESPDCTATRLTGWVDEMSQYIKSLDSNHLVSVGDAGYLNRAQSSDIYYNNSSGDDFEAFLSLSAVDFGTFHLYIDNPAPGHTLAWGVQVVADHAAAAAPIGKPVVMEEFGHADATTQSAVFQQLTDAAYNGNLSGWMVWDVQSSAPDGTHWPSDDQYDITVPSDTATLIGQLATHMNR